MYRNEIKEDDGKDIAGEKLKKLDLMYDRYNAYKAVRISEDIAHYAMLWLKYYREDNTDYIAMANSSTADNCYTNQEWDKIVENSKTILKDKYDISVLSDNPLILSSPVPFNQINENIY